MSEFSVKYISKTNGIVRERVFAKNGEELRRFIETEKDAILLEYKEHFSPKKSNLNYVIFAYEMRTLLKSGISIAEALSILKDNNVNYNDVIQQLFNGLHEGLSFSNAMKSTEYKFPNLLIATVAASEKNGTIIHALANYISYEESITKVKSKVVSASIYPLVLIVVSFFIILFLLIYLVPKFSLIYQDVSVELPFLSSTLLSFGSIVYEHKIAFSVSVAILIALIGLYIKKIGIQILALKIVKLNKYTAEISEKFLLSRFYRGFALLLESGSSVMDAFSLMEDSLSTTHEKKVKEAKLLILKGNGLSHSLIQSQLTTPISARLLTAGDRNGEIVNMLKQSSEFYEMEIENFIERFSQIIEPVLMIIIGFFIGGIIVLLYMPIFDLANSI